MAKAAKRHTFTNSAKNANQFRQALVKFRAILDERRELWQLLTPEQRERIEAIDPVLQMARNLYVELGGWFQ
jgi:uncharacterized protein (DUF2384 family)